MAADLNTVEILSPWQAMYDILPWDVVTEFRAQLGGGFGLVHKIQKKKANATPTATTKTAIPKGGEVEMGPDPSSDVTV